MANEPEFIKYPRIPHLGGNLSILDNPVEVYEKLDGGNTQIRTFQNRILCGSRGHYLKREEQFSCSWFKDFQHWTLSNYSLFSLPKNLIVYGEFLAHHVLDYNPEFVNKFFVIDVFNIDTGKFVPYPLAKEKLIDLGIRDVCYLNTLINGKVGQGEIYELLKHSDYRKGYKEGVVIKKYEQDPQEFAKLWTSLVYGWDSEPKNAQEVSYNDIKRLVLGINDETRGKIRLDELVAKVIRELQRTNANITCSKKEIEKLISQCLNEISNC